MDRSYSDEGDDFKLVFRPTLAQCFRSRRLTSTSKARDQPGGTITLRHSHFFSIIYLTRFGKRDFFLTHLFLASNMIIPDQLLLAHGLSAYLYYVRVREVGP